VEFLAAHLLTSIRVLCEPSGGEWNTGDTGYPQVGEISLWVFLTVKHRIECEGHAVDDQLEHLQQVQCCTRN